MSFIGEWCPTFPNVVRFSWRVFLRTADSLAGRSLDSIKITYLLGERGKMLYKLMRRKFVV
jgi:hypothetical protein